MGARLAARLCARGDAKRREDECCGVVFALA